MSKKEEIIRLLAQSEAYVSGQELCERFGVSRTAIWKTIKQLEKEGYHIEAVNNKGYRLIENDDMMSEIEIARYMDTEKMGRQLVFYKKTDSTNLDVKRLAEDGGKEGTLVVADMQEAGRGRRGRAWVSPSGEAIYMSLLLRPSCAPNQASAITLVMAIAILEAVEELKPGICGIKWPNDLVINGKKMCGILTEMSMEMDAIHYVVVGVGVNANQEVFAEEIANTATSLYLELGHKVNRSKFVASAMHYFEKNYQEYEKTFDLSGLVDKYNQYLLNRDKEVRVLDPKGEYEGVALGIDDKGELLVRKQDGTIVTVYAGEVSVRGIYGYI